MVRGFANGSGEGCTRRIWYFRGIVAVLTPYVGAVVATAYDTTGAYLLFNNTAGLYVGKFSSARVFQRTVGLSRIAQTVGGDIVASGGRCGQPAGP